MVKQIDKSEITTLIKENKENIKHLNILKKHIEKAREINNEWFIMLIDFLLDYFVSVDKVSHCSNIHFYIRNNTLYFAIKFSNIFIDFEKITLNNIICNSSLKEKLRRYFIYKDIVVYNDISFRFLHSSQFLEFYNIINSRFCEFEIRKIS